MKKRPNRRTHEQRAAQRATAELLETRIQALTEELEASGSPYVRAPRNEQLELALRRIDAELAERPERD